MSHMQVTFHLATPICYDAHEPIHLDALLAWGLAPRQGAQRNLSRDDIPDLVRLPLLRHSCRGGFVWQASALLPDGEKVEDLQFWRKRFRQGRSEHTSGSPNLTNGAWRDWQVPVHLISVPRLVAYASGSANEVRKLLREVKYLGKKRAHGHGKLARIEVEKIPENKAITCEGRAMRWLPHRKGTRYVRLIPPYWHPHQRVNCCEVGEKV